MSVTLLRKVRLLVGAGGAKPGPAIGQALGPLGVNMAEFCKQFNEKTKDYVKDVPIPVELSAFSNRSFQFICKTPTTSWFLKKCAGIEVGAARPGHETCGDIHVKQIYEIAQEKLKDEHLKNISLKSMAKCIAASAKSIGLEVVGGAGGEVGKKLPKAGKPPSGKANANPEAAKAADAKKADAKKPATDAKAGAGDKKTGEAKPEKKK